MCNKQKKNENMLIFCMLNTRNSNLILFICVFIAYSMSLVSSYGHLNDITDTWYHNVVVYCYHQHKTRVKKYILNFNIVVRN